ncbi:hypothetical protein [Halalkalibacillus halophilus]|uniref:hypothetical protein n=1 Tax=Halalkalibacillus halophilus TaxID=392827 RepID=UPI0003F887F8|nr:hypothetical protein [Halalkalibacillus halophilus]
MKYLTILELKKSIFSSRFLLVFVLVIFLIVAAGYDQINFALSAGFDDMGALYFFTLGHASPTSLLGVLAPIIVTIPYAHTYALERNTGFIREISFRVEKRKYLWAKFWANFVTGGLIIFLPLSIIYVIYIIVFGVYPFPNPSAGPLGHLAVESPTIYGFFIIIISTIFGAVYASIGIAVSSLFHKTIISHIVPFMVFLLPAFIFPFIGLDRIEPSTTWSPNLNANTTLLGVLSQLSFLLITSLCIYSYGIRKKGVLYEKTE